MSFSCKFYNKYGNQVSDQAQSRCKASAGAQICIDLTPLNKALQHETYQFQFQFYHRTLFTGKKKQLNDIQ